MGNVYSIVTEKIISLLEEGTIPWKKPRRGDGLAPKSLSSGREYRGINA